MNLRNVDEYSIGLDIGSASVGWVVIDADGNLCHFNSKPTWGSRLFPSAQTAAEARLPRGQRRRYNRRRQRLNLLQGLFCEQMKEVDETFFVRLNQARLLREDKTDDITHYRWLLFNATDFTEQDYYDRFPTIYHLRAWLMETNEQADLRLVYLALHNIVKTRGNFLRQDNPNLSAKNANMKDSIEQFCLALEQWAEERDFDAACKPKKMQIIFEDASTTRREKLDALVPLLGLQAEEPKLGKEILSALLGYKVDFAKMFGLEGESQKFDLENDEAIGAFLEVCPDDCLEVFETMQAVHSAYILSGILKGGQGKTLSYCKVQEYERYKNDLATLKALVRKYVPSEYDRFFRGPHYASAQWKKDYDPTKAQGYTLYNLGTSKLSYENFAKEVEKLLKGTKASGDPIYQEMLASFKEGVFLRRLKTSDNGSIPYQLHLEEMRAIIQNQGKYYPFLLQEQEKLESLVTFRIPYYVGPLTTKNARRVHDNAEGATRFAWSVRQSGQEHMRIYPWNWDEVIDKGKSAEEFIRRMTGTCTYLQGEPVLPRCSLLYEKFCVLNELNGSHWTQDGDKEQRFSAADRLGIYDDLFKHGTVTYKKVEEWLEQHHRLHPHVKGGQGETKYESKLSSYLFFRKVLAVDEIDASLEPMIEDIILWNTLFEDRDILKEKITKAYGDVLSPDQIKQICKKRFSGWGNLSRKVLCELKIETANGKMSIMDILEDGNPEGTHLGGAMVLMEILRDEHFGFQNAIDEHNKQRLLHQGGMAVDELPGSPALRRSVNQSLRIVEEIVKVAGKAPANIFIEVTRDDNKKKKGKRTTRRYDEIKDALTALKSEGASTLSELKALSPDQLDKRLSLYFMQNGKSLYSGKPLDIRRVINGDEAYQVDHIIPRSYTKDDSFENLALVLAEENQRKTDNLLLDESIRRHMARYWRSLHDAKLIGDKKYNNLMRDHISEKQMQGFIARQIVETSQAVKFVRTMLTEAYPQTHVESVKASLSHQLREAQGFVKCREANNFHHAHDALLAAEIGRFIQLRHPVLFENPIAATHAMRDFIRSQSAEYQRTHRMPGSASFVVGSFLTSGFNKETGEVFKDTWNAQAECAKIRRFLNYKQCYISRMPEITSGAFWDATIYSPKGSTKALSLPLKKGFDPNKYGSYSREQFAYFFVYRAIKKGKPQLCFAAVPVSVAARVEKDESTLDDYAQQLAFNAGMEYVGIARRRVYKYQLIELNGSRVYITGIKEARNATEVALGQGDMLTLFRLIEGDMVQSDALDRVLLAFFDNCKRYSTVLGERIAYKSTIDKALAASKEIKRKLIIGLSAIINGQSNVIDLTDIGGVKFAGKIGPAYTKELTAGNVEFIDQSVTGMFERRQRLEL